MSKIGFFKVGLLLGNIPDGICLQHFPIFLPKLLFPHDFIRLLKELYSIDDIIQLFLLSFLFSPG